MTTKKFRSDRSHEAFIVAEQNRSSVLAFLHANPGAVLRDVMKHMDMEPKRAAQILNRMRELGEVRRETGGIGLNGAKCSKYFAIAERTITAEEVLAKMIHNIHEPAPVVVMVARQAPVHRLFGGL